MKKIQNFRIGTWLFTGFTIILFLVVLLGVMSYQQTRELSLQTETMYNHPLTVRRGIDRLELDVSELRLQFRNYILADTVEDEHLAIDAMDLAFLHIDDELDTIENGYLGPEEDIDNLKTALTLWVSVRTINMDKVAAGEIDEVLISIGPDGEEAIKRNNLLERIDVIDSYAQNKADELYANSITLHETMVTQLIFIVSLLFLLTLFIGIWLFRSFKKPLYDMNMTVRAFQSGDMSNRVEFASDNELGELATSINNMADVIESNEKMHKLTNDFSDVLINENVTNQFMKIVLKTLLNYTGSVASAIHLYNENKNEFEYYDSIGFDKERLLTLKIDKNEGEFANVIRNKEVQIVKLHNTNSNIIYNTLSVGLIPNEILSIPLVTSNKVIAIISLASVDVYTEQNIEFVEQIHDNLTSRTEAILATEKINDFIDELEQRSQELVAQNAELEVQKKQLNEASKLKSNFLSNMSHELRTPLNSVIALSGVLYDRLKDNIPDEEYSYLEIIGRNGRNLLSLINDILDISRIESGRVEVDVKNFNMNQTISEVSSMFMVQAKQKGINLEHINKNNRIFVNTDYDKCMHIIQNLISNAVKFTNEGSVTIEAISKENQVDIIVTDTGIGISAENLEKIFEEFKQAESGTSRRFGGTGLGLSIAKKYANMLDGDVLVNSKPGSGSTFTLTIPKNYTSKDAEASNFIIPKSEEEIPAPKLSHSAMMDTLHKNDKTVLVVDDNESVIIQIKDLVQGMGVNLLVATNGETALKMIEDHKVDAIILDLMMPGINGFDVLQGLRDGDKTAHLPVLILTAKHITKQELSTLKRNNIHQLVQKGDVDRIELQKMIFNMLYKPNKSSKKISRSTIPKILIVEDNKDNRTTLKALLKDVGDIIEAVDGEEGIEMAKMHVPNIILMDIALPKVSGIEAFHKIRSNKKLKHIPIVAITASALEDEKSNILSHGFDDFIPKPIVPKTLSDSMERLLYND